MKVEPGQVWQNKLNRVVRILEVDSRYVYGIANGRHTRILLSNFKAKYTLVKESKE